MPAYRESDVPAQAGKTIFITGANTGIGFETARIFADHGARVLLGCRSETKARNAITAIRALVPDADLDWVPLDLADLASIEKAAAIVRTEERLDALINNAGVMTTPKMQTTDGFELQFGINHLGHFALTGHLIEKMKDRSGARVVTVSSLAHRNGSIDYDDVHAHSHYNRLTRYNMSKFANILFTYELQRKLTAAGQCAIAVACHPGVSSQTELLRHLPGPLYAISSMLSPLLNSRAEGALPTLLAATGSGVTGGDYFGPTKLGEMKYSAQRVDTAPASQDESNATKLWALSTELTGVNYGL